MKPIHSSLFFVCALLAATSASAGQALRPAGRTELPGYTGDFDHLEYDLESKTLWLAAEDHGTLDAFDLETGALRSSRGGVVETPHAVAYLKAQRRLVVTDSGGADKVTKVIDGEKVRPLPLAALAADAMVHDRSTGRLYIVNGGRDAGSKTTHVSAVDAATLERVGDARIDTDKVEALAVEQKGNRLYVNITGRHELAVLDKRDLSAIATWKIEGPGDNAPLALDEEGRRLFVVTRKPGRLVVVDADRGATVASFKAPERCDQVIWDATHRRVYALGGEGFIGVFQQDDADHYRELERVPTAPGAKTGILVPELNRLFVAVSPGEGRTGAAILRLDVLGAQRFYRLEASSSLKSASPEWDYVTLDEERGRLFVSRRADGVTVFDVNSRQVVRTIADSAEANAVTLVHEFDRGYTTNGDGSTTIFQLSTLETIARVKLGEDADSGFYDPATKQIAFTMGDSHQLAFVHAGTGKPAATLTLDSKKLDGAAADGEGHLFLALRDRDRVARIDMAAHRLDKLWDTGDCKQPTSVAYDRAHRRIFVGCRGVKPVLAVMDSISGKVLSLHEIGRGNDGVVYDAEARRIYTSNGVDGNLVIYDQLDADNYRFSEATTTRPYARTMALDSRTKKVYLVTAEGTADPGKAINRGVAPFYPNRYYADTFTILTFAPKE